MLKEGKIVNNRQRNRAFAQGASGDAAVPEALRNIYLLSEPLASLSAVAKYEADLDQAIGACTKENDKKDPDHPLACGIFDLTKRKKDMMEQRLSSNMDHQIARWYGDRHVNINRLLILQIVPGHYDVNTEIVRIMQAVIDY
ncbi:5717_t:CDS:2 [Paraglomus brasilianum]|uniref:5717_t:CDS:1 n=1 Tax=Paraglomus brasilianum TaxID=144538 RepID=A0A9N9BX93_9GLOM|nr:5717_t:CDS:2 [Paraglomus brasilianum]